MRATTKIPAIPDVPVSDPVTVRLFGPIKEVIEIREGRRGGDNLDKHVSYRDLVNLGLITEAQVPKK